MSRTPLDRRERRRGELSALVRQRGHPDAINQTRLAEAFDVSQSQISQDFDRLGRHVHAELIDRDRRAFFVDTVVRRSIRALIDEEEWNKAGNLVIKYDDWITGFDDLDQLFEDVEQLKAEDDTHL